MEPLVLALPCGAPGLPSLGCSPGCKVISSLLLVLSSRFVDLEKFVLEV